MFKTQYKLNVFRKFQSEVRRKNVKILNDCDKNNLSSAHIHKFYRSKACCIWVHVLMKICAFLLCCSFAGTLNDVCSIKPAKYKSKIDQIIVNRCRHIYMCENKGMIPDVARAVIYFAFSNRRVFMVQRRSCLVAQSNISPLQRAR